MITVTLEILFSNTFYEGWDSNSRGDEPRSGNRSITGSM